MNQSSKGAAPPTVATSATPKGRRRHRRLGLSTLAVASVVAVFSSGCAVFTAIPGVTGCNITPPNSFWRANITTLPVHAKSATYVNTIGATAPLKADFGSGLYQGSPIGIPYNVVPGTQTKRTVTFEFWDESDDVGYPIPNPPKIEGGGDRHVLMVDKDNCRLYELYKTYPGTNNDWTSGITAGSGATWDMRSNAMRPDTWTSGDAAGLQILPGLVRYEEVNAGSGTVRHAIRMTVPDTAGVYVWPASHKTNSLSPNTYPPMGTWVRLKSTINPANFDPYVRPIIVALKTYGGVVADNGGAWFMSGVPDSRWDNAKLATLAAIHGSDFEIVDASSEKVANNSYQARTAS
jgi:hypothetical protein